MFWRVSLMLPKKIPAIKLLSLQKLLKSFSKPSLLCIYNMKKIIWFLIFISLNSCSFVSSRNKNIFFRGTFLKIEKKIKLTACNPIKPKECLTRRYESTASSFLYKHEKDKSFLITAAHVCNNNYGKLVFFPGFEAHEEFYGLTLDLEKHHYTVEKIDFASDLCIVSTKRFKATPYRIAANLPSIGEEVYNIAAPGGVFAKKIAPLFKGFYSGSAHTRSIFTLPAMGGSSGSPVLDANGRVIGVVSAVTKNFSNIVISPTLKQIKNIIKSVNK
jgi:S1-C subfamily serine protease